MKVFTNRLWHFAGCALVVSIAFQFAMNLFVLNSLTAILIALVYFCIMYLVGWYFGKKDYQENNIYDIGIRWHVVTFLICNGLGYLFWYLFFHEAQDKVSLGTARSALTIINWTALFWGISVVIHFIVFLFTRKNAIKGYDKTEIFE